MRIDDARMTYGRSDPALWFLISCPATCFAGAFITDLAYWQTFNIIWETFSVWLLTAGLVMAGVAIVAGLIDRLLGAHSHTPILSWFTLGYLLVLVLSVFNAFVHSRDGYTAVVPTGLALSGIVVILMFLTGWMGVSLVHRREVGVTS